jgi:hypothetical protein
MRIVVVFLLSALVGTLLAGPWIDWPIQEGWLGVALMVGAALYMRRHWQRRAAERGDEPGEREQEIWHGFASTSLIGAQIVTSLWLAGPGMLMHSAASNRLGILTWTLVGGAVLSWYLLHRREPLKDERDLAIQAQAQKASATVLALLIVTVSVTLAFNPPERLAPLSFAFLANVLLLLLVIASLVRHAVELWSYQRDAGPAA